MVSVFLSLLRFALWPSMWSVLEDVLCALRRRYSLLLFGGMLYKYHLGLSGLMCHSFKTHASLLIFCGDMCIDESGMFKPPTIIVLSISSFTVISICLTCWVLLYWVHIYLWLLYLLLGLIPWSLCTVLLCLISQAVF